MKDVLTRKKKMYIAVLAVLLAWKDFWKNLPAFTDNYEKLDKFITDIEAKNISLESSTVITEEKRQKFDEMIDLALTVAGVGTSYANKQKDNALVKTFKYSPSAIREGNEEDVCKRCTSIAKAAEPIKDKLVEHGLAIESAPALADLTEAVLKLIPKPHVAIKSHKSGNEEMEDMFHDCDAFLEGELDQDMRIFSKPQPNFITEYFTAREIGGWPHPDDKKDDGTDDGGGGAAPTK